ncbi:MAG: ABC transporter permease [SAR202 cluster bacterium]|nr:ABC transporter permease [SAR202 cluster bacterium]
MANFLIKRLLLMVVTLWVVSVLVFTLSRVQGDPREMFLQRGVTQEMWDEWGVMMGLDKPLAVQYLIWASKAIRGDLGNSNWERRPVIEAVAEKFPATLQLGLSTFLFSVGIGLPLGILSAIRRGTIADYIGRFIAVTGQALPPFWIGLVLILIFSVKLNWLPSAKKDGIESFVLPTITLGWLFAASILRLVRSSMLNVLDEEYIKLAKAKGASQNMVIWKHAFKNAVAAPLTYGGLLLAALFTGAVVTESVFGWPGLGRTSVEAVLQNDYPMLIAIVMLFTLVFIIANFLVDITLAILDPRIRYS